MSAFSIPYISFICISFQAGLDSFRRASVSSLTITPSDNQPFCSEQGDVPFKCSQSQTRRRTASPPNYSRIPMAPRPTLPMTTLQDDLVEEIQAQSLSNIMLSSDLPKKELQRRRRTKKSSPEDLSRGETPNLRAR